MYCAILRELSATFRLESGKLFSALDQSIFKDAAIDYEHLRENLSQIALLNAGSAIMIKDTTGKYVRQDYFQYPTGVLHLFDRIYTARSLDVHYRRQNFNFFFTEDIAGFRFRIAVGLTVLWANEATIISFAGNQKTIEHGSLVDGILKGVIGAAKEFIGPESARDFEFSRRRLISNKHLVVVAHVSQEGYQFKYAGSVPHKIEEPKIKKAAAYMVHDKCLAHMRNNPEDATRHIEGIFKLWDQ